MTTKSDFFGGLFLSSRVLKGTSQVFLWTARHYHSLYMLGLGVCSFFSHYLGDT